MYGCSIIRCCGNAVIILAKIGEKWDNIIYLEQTLRRKYQLHIAYAGCCRLLRDVILLCHKHVVPVVFVVVIVWSSVRVEFSCLRRCDWRKFEACAPSGSLTLEWSARRHGACAVERQEEIVCAQFPVIYLHGLATCLSASALVPVASTLDPSPFEHRVFYC